MELSEAIQLGFNKEKEYFTLFSLHFVSISTETNDLLIL